MVPLPHGTRGGGTAAGAVQIPRAPVRIGSISSSANQMLSHAVRRRGRPEPGTTKALDAVCCIVCARSSTDRASDYGSEGWGFESLRARRQRPVPIAEPASCLACTAAKYSSMLLRLGPGGAGAVCLVGSRGGAIGPVVAEQVAEPPERTLVEASGTWV